MPEAVGAYAAARDAVRAAGERLTALGTGVDRQLDALLARLAALPAAAGPGPFGDLGSLLGAATAGATGSAAQGAKTSARGAPAKPKSASGSGSSSSPAMATRAASDPRQPTAATGVGAASGGAGVPSIAGARAPGVADALLVEPMLQTVAALARLTRPSTSRTAAPADSPLALPGALANELAQWTARQLERAATPPATPDKSFGRVITDLLSDPDVLNARRRKNAPQGQGREAAATSSAAPKAGGNATTEQAPQADATGLRGPAPRAPSRLALPDDTAAPSKAADAASTATGSNDPDDDPVDAMVRALVDQAWLRGVDLR